MKRNLFFDEPKNRPEKLLACLLGCVHKLFLLGPPFFLTSVFGFTLLSSRAALFSVSKKLLDGCETNVVKDYFRFFKNGFKKTFPVSCLFFLLFLSGAFSVGYYFSSEGFASKVGGILSLSLLLLLSLFFFFFPLAERTPPAGVFSSFLKNIPKCALCLFCSLLLVGVPAFLLPFSFPVFFTLSPTLSCLLSVFILDNDEVNE